MCFPFLFAFQNVVYTVHRLYYSRYSVHYANVVAVAAQLLRVNTNPKYNYDRFIIFLSLFSSKPQLVCSCIQKKIVIIIISVSKIVPFKNHNPWKGRRICICAYVTGFKLLHCRSTYSAEFRNEWICSSNPTCAMMSCEKSSDYSQTLFWNLNFGRT